jgi:hypothetical protein
MKRRCTESCKFWTPVFHFFILAAFIFPATLASQPFSKKYLMAFHTCTTNCAFQFHETHIAESNDGSTWSLVPNLPYFSGSVPDLVVRGTKLYLYNPGIVRRYDNSTSLWDSSPANVSVVDSIGNPVNFVDPSPTVDANGNIVLFFLNSTGITGDPATCNPYPCVKYFDSAVEVPGSDGAQFLLQSAHRLTVNLSSGSASDPDIYFDGSQYILYYSAGSSTKALYSSTLHGAYTAFGGLNNGELTNQGGIPCGHYEASSGQYWTYVHANGMNGTEIKRVTHSNFNASVNTATTVISGTNIGLTSQHKCESPGFCENDFLQSADFENAAQDVFTIYPNPLCANEFTLKGKVAGNAIEKIELSDLKGAVQNLSFGQKENPVIKISTQLNPGMYFLRIYSREGICLKKLIVQ